MRGVTKRFIGATAMVMPLLCSSPALASTLLDMGPPNNTTYRSTDGPGQLVNVSTNTTLTNIGFYSASPNGGDLKYMIWDGTNSTLLFSIVGAGPVTSTPTLTFSPDFVFNLLAGSSYYFGIISDAAANYGYTYPPITVSQNGLTATGVNSNYENYASPTFEGDAGASINLVLLGSQSGGAVPEPATWMMLILGFGAVGLTVRKAKRQEAKFA